jgi:hypothetical protein
MNCWPAQAGGKNTDRSDARIGGLAPDALSANPSDPELYLTNADKSVTQG